MDELDHKKIFNKIIFKQSEPSVLNENIIRKSIYEQGPTGEAGRLFKLDELEYTKLTVLRLEFQNILKIDHLWILPNLQVLSLAYNKIDKIENLDSLKNLKELNLTFNCIENMENLDELKSLEILSIFGNQIRKIENVDGLENLIIFSAGNNLIDTTNGIERLRFLKKLRSLNLKGNEVEKTEKYFRIFIAGLLPDLNYYEYIHISKEERDEGKDRFRFKLREIMETEKIEVIERELVIKEKADEIHLLNCFVELLNRHQVFNTLFEFENEEQGECLLAIGSEADTLITEFREQSFTITQSIHKIGLVEFDRRKNELETFKKCSKKGKIEIQLRGQETINQFIDNSEEKFIHTMEIVERFKRQLSEKSEENEEIETLTKETDDKIIEVTDEFNFMYDETWKSLMENEMHLHESVIEANTNFEHVIQDMMNDFVEQCKMQFVQLREVENNFIDALIEAVQGFVTLKAASGNEDEIPEELIESLVDRDIVFNYSSGMRDMQMQKIDAKEDILISRGREWVKDLCIKMQEDEIDRNRKKVMEINYFLDTQREKFDQITSHMYNESNDTESILDKTLN